MNPYFLSDTLTPTDTHNDAGAAGFVIAQFVIALVGAAIHVAVDRRRHPDAGARRTVELFLVWFLAVAGVGTIIGGIMHVSGLSDELAIQIGYTQSMFQWEIGWADIGIGVLLVGCVWLRGSWMTAAVVLFAVSYWGDAIGHFMQWSQHDNTAPANVWTIPGDVLSPLIGVILLVAFRRLAQTPREAVAAA